MFLLRRNSISVYKISILGLSGCYLIDGIKLELKSQTNTNPADLPLEVVQKNIGDCLKVKSKCALRTSCRNGNKVFNSEIQMLFLPKLIEELDKIVKRTSLDPVIRSHIMDGDHDYDTYNYVELYPYIHNNNNHTAEYFLMRESTKLLRVLNTLKKNDVAVNSQIPEKYRLLYEWSNVNSTAKHVSYYWNNDYFGPINNYSRPAPGEFKCYYYTWSTWGINCCKYPMATASKKNFSWTEKVMETWRSLLVSNNILNFVVFNSHRKLKELNEDGYYHFRDFLNEYKKYINSNKLQLYSILLDESIESFDVESPNINKTDLEDSIKKINAKIDKLLLEIERLDIEGRYNREE